MTGMLYAALAVICAVVAGTFFYFQVNVKDINDISNLYVAIPALILALIFAGLFFSGKVNKEEEIHITK
jgi:ABC-type antimicrobial peptide transport system permease subunit